MEHIKERIIAASEAMQDKNNLTSLWLETVMTVFSV